MLCLIIGHKTGGGVESIEHGENTGHTPAPKSKTYPAGKGGKGIQGVGD